MQLSADKMSVQTSRRNLAPVHCRSMVWATMLLAAALAWRLPERGAHHVEPEVDPLP